jgi:tetratricopeptide (TPR) repeat protein
MEELKERGNALFAERKYRDAFKEYGRALELVGDDRRARAVLHSNRSACLLSLGDAAGALKEGKAAVEADSTFEKGFVRCGAALEAMSGRRAEALEAYRRAAGSSEVAAKRVKVLEVPREVTLAGVTGIENGSLDPRQLEPFDNATQYFRQSLLLHESLGEVCQVGLCQYQEDSSYLLRVSMYRIAAGVERRAHVFPYGPVKEPALKSVVLRDEESAIVLELRMCDGFKRLEDIDNDGRELRIVEASSSVPIIAMSWKDVCREFDPSIGVVRDDSAGYVVAVEVLLRLRQHLESNAKLLAPDFKASLELDRGFAASFLSPMSTPALEYRVREGCAVRGCNAEFAKFRCSNCYLARYCGAEHSKQHWSEHKKSCTPLMSRPHLQFSVAEAKELYLATWCYLGLLLERAAGLRQWKESLWLSLSG